MLFSSFLFFFPVQHISVKLFNVLLSADWPTVQPGTCAKDVAKIMAGSKTGWAVVTGDPEDVSDIVGIVTERDIIRKALSSDTGDVTSMDVGDIMTPKAKLITVSASDSVWEITRVFIDKGIRAGLSLNIPSNNVEVSKGKEVNMNFMMLVFSPSA